MHLGLIKPKEEIKFEIIYLNYVNIIEENEYKCKILKDIPTFTIFSSFYFKNKFIDGQIQINAKNEIINSKIHYKNNESDKLEIIESKYLDGNTKKSCMYKYSYNINSQFFGNSSGYYGTKVTPIIRENYVIFKTIINEKENYNGTSILYKQLNPETNEILYLLSKKIYKNIDNIDYNNTPALFMINFSI